jgi:hypothetical protein
MCEPISATTAVTLAASAASAAAAAGGAYMQYQGTQAQARDRDNAQARAAQAARAEAARQDGLTARRRAEAGAIRDEAAPVDVQQRMDDAVAARTANPSLPTDGNDPNQDLLGGQAGASGTVRNVISDRMAETRAKLGREALARAKLSSWGDAFMRTGEAQQGARERLDMYGDFARGSSGTLGLETSGLGTADPNAGAGGRMIGSALSGAGNAGLSNAGTIGSWFAPTPPPATARLNPPAAAPGG